MFEGEVLYLFLLSYWSTNLCQELEWGWGPGHMHVDIHKFLYEYNYGVCIFFKLRLAEKLVISLSLLFIGLSSAMCFLSYKEQQKQFPG